MINLLSSVLMSLNILLSILNGNLTEQIGVFEIKNNSNEFTSLQADQYDYTSDYNHENGVYILSFYHDDCISYIKIK